jgi:hypothetical protein
LGAAPAAHRLSVVGPRTGPPKQREVSDMRKRVITGVIALMARRRRKRHRHR